MRRRRIANLDVLQEKALEEATIKVKEFEARHYLIWWLSSYQRVMKRGLNNETISLSEFQINEFKFSYAVTDTVEKFYLLIQPENWFFNNLNYESAFVDEYGLVLNLAEINDPILKIYVSRMQVRFNLDESHKQRLNHAKKYSKELVLIKYDPIKNEVEEVGKIIDLKNNSVTLNTIGAKATKANRGAF